MNVSLHVDAGPHLGRRIDLKPGQSASFGSTDHADFCFEKDGRMGDVHFRVTVGVGAARLDQVSEENEIIKDGEPASSIELLNGLKFTTGQTVFKVVMDELAPEIPIEQPPELEAEFQEEAIDLVTLGKKLELSEEGQPLCEQYDDTDGLMEGLRSENHLVDAVRLQAYLLEKPNALQWVTTTIQEMPEIQLSPEQEECLNAALLWSENPEEEEQRRVCERLSEEHNQEGIGALLALAAFFSGDNLAPEEFIEPVPPDEFVSSQVLTGIVDQAVGECPPLESEANYLKFLESASQFQ